MTSEPLDALHTLCQADPVWADRYEGWTELGRGASATVVRTFSRAAGEEVALKLFQRLDEEDRERFRQEVRHCQRLTSPFVVRTYSPFVRSTLAWIEMEWVDGPDLRQELERRRVAGEPFDSGHARAIGAAVAQALDVAHAAGVVHRDVKPANVLLPRDGQPVAKLGDFGISRVAGAARVTSTGILAGTPQFVSPEVVAGQRADQRSDVYSLGLVLYLLFSNGRFPFEVGESDSPAQWLQAHVHARPRPLQEWRPGLDPELYRLLTDALAKDPRQRPGAGELAAALSPQPTFAPPRRVRPGGRVTLAAAVGALAGLCLGAWLARDVRPTREVDGVPPPAVVASPQPSPTLQESPLAVRFEGDLLTLTSHSRLPLERLTLVLESPGGLRVSARSLAPVEPGDELTLALGGFQPVPPPGFRPVAIELEYESAGLLQRTRLPWPSSAAPRANASRF